MSIFNKSEDANSSQSSSQSETKSRSHSRRAFLKGIGAAATIVGSAPVAAAAAQHVMPDVLSDTSSPTLNLKARRGQAFHKRVSAAYGDRKTPTASGKNNGDEALYTSGIFNGVANFTKGLGHMTSPPNVGVVESAPYTTYLNAIKTGKLADFDLIQLEGTIPLVDPQAGIAFDLETCDPSQNSIPLFATLTSPDLAAQMIETYWLSLTRDVAFSQWSSDSTIAAACAELTNLSAYNGPRINGSVTPQALFRGLAFDSNGRDQTIGPYVSQLFLQPFSYGVLPFVGYKTTLPGDFGITESSWLNIQNGAPSPLASENPDPNLRYLGTGRDLAEYVHNDILYQEYLNAALMLATMGAPLNSGNPYNSLKSESGFITFGLPMVQNLVAEVITRAIKNAWFQKWFIHRVARPEEIAGLVHYTKTTTNQQYPLDKSVLNSVAAQTVYNRNSTYFIPLSYPEGCPLHPSYPSGHATAAGAATTILKWFFDETATFGQKASNGVMMPGPLTTTDNGSTPVSYTGSDANQLTVGGEINKLGFNVGFGRVFSGIHWREDIQQGMYLGEEIAINLLRDQAHLYNENYKGFIFTRFNGAQIQV
jgi:membrane-associated phospholipid phosphatase